MVEELQDRQPREARRSFWPGLVFLAAAAAAKAIGAAMAEAAVDSASVSGSFLSAGRDLQRAASIEGMTDFVMIVLGVIGIILLIRASISRPIA
jgi:hypothetical protein